MDFIDMDKDFAQQVKFYGSTLQFAVSEVDAMDEVANSLFIGMCGDCISFDIYGDGPDDASKCIMVSKSDALKIAEYLTAICNL